MPGRGRKHTSDKKHLGFLSDGLVLKSARGTGRRRGCDAIYSDLLLVLIVVDNVDGLDHIAQDQVHVAVVRLQVISMGPGEKGKKGGVGIGIRAGGP